MLCPKCKTNNDLNSLYCTQCGTSLRYGEKPPWAGISKWGLISLILFWLGGLAYIFQDFIISPQDDVDKEVADVLPPEIPPVKNTEINIAQLPTGWVEIQNRWGNQVSRIRAVIVNGSWIALPTRACIGGDTWLFETDTHKKIKIDKGFWKQGDSIGLWHLDGKAAEQDKPVLAPWQQKKPLKWRSLSSNGSPIIVTILPQTRQGMFIHCSVPEQINAAGVLVQDNQAVGWTFGSGLKGAFLWASETKIHPDNATITVKDFYEATFANGREEQFSKALAMGDEVPAIDKLAAFSQGFGMKPKLSLQDTPPPLLPATIEGHIHSLTTQLLQKEEYKDLIDIFGSPRLIKFVDRRLLLSVVRSAANRYGHKNGIVLLDTALENLDPGTGIITDLSNLHARLYQEWIQQYLDDGDIRGGWQVFTEAQEYHPYEPEIHLLGVELTLAEMDWREAEKLLSTMNYPAYLNNRLHSLYARISEMKAREGKIVVYFPAGHKIIPVTARLNDALEQNFLIDTGASLVTIPASSIDSLGIEIDAEAPARLVSTAGGVKTATEVTLSSIELEGWTVYDVQALVLDIPGTPNLGLLGLNYLSRFHMNLDSEKGVLMLEPK